MLILALGACDDQSLVAPVAVPSTPLPINIASVVVAPATVTLQTFGVAQLEALVTGTDNVAITGRPVVWSTSNPGIVTVDQTGRITALTAGTAEVTATVDGNRGKTIVSITLPPTIPPPNASTNPWAGAKFWIDPYSRARLQADKWRTSRPPDAAQMDRLAAQPNAFWLGGWYADERQTTSQTVSEMTAAGALPVLVLYNIPQRDCGSYSAGGASSPAAYREWVRSIADGIGGRRAVVILEPDAIAGADCLSAADQETRFALIREAVTTLKARGGVHVYIDAGNPVWHTPAEAAARLQRAAIAAADGFALNVSNFETNASNASYGVAVSAKVGGKHFLVDTSRNGLGPGSHWCNPAGRALGTAPTTNTNHPLIDAFLWIKLPGESDGTCNGGPAAGEWFADYALRMAQRTTDTMLATTLASSSIIAN